MSTWTGSVTLTAGSVVNMKRGDTWSSSSTSAPYMEVAQSGTSGRPIITTAYGSGAKPVIKFTVTTNYPVIEGLGKAYITFDNLDIQNASSTRSINYEANGINFGKDGSSNLPHDWIITNCAIHNCSRTGIEGLDDAYNITIGNINTTSTATTSVFNNEIYNCGYAGIILCGRNSATSRSDLNVYGNYIHNIDYNASAAEDGVGVSFTSESINGSGEGYSTGWPSYCTAKYNYISNVPGGVGVDGHGGTYIYFQNNYVKDCRIGIMQQAADRVYAESAILDHGYIENNIIENTGAAITGSNHAFIYTVAENVAKRATNCYVRYNTLFYTTRPATETGAMGVGFYNVNGLTIDGNYVYNGPTGAAGGGIAESASGNSKSVIIQNNYIVNWSESIYLSAGHIDGTVAVNSNIVRSHLIPFHIDDGTVVSGGIVSLYNNTLLTSNASSPCHAVDMGGITLASGSSVTIKDNIIGGTVTNAYTIYVFGPATVTGTFACNYNLYWNSTRSNPYYVSGGGNTFAAWQALTYDANSFNNTDPLFTNGGGSYNLASDFALQAGSPALDVGINTGVTLDYYGNARNGNYDLGAVEKQ
jgi:hypothetical protein